MIDISLATKIADIITLILSTYFFIQNLKRIKGGARYLIGVIVYVLYIVPLFIDYFYMLPEYRPIMSGFATAREDTATNILFDLFFIILQYCLLYRKNKRDKSGGNSLDTSFTLSTGCRKLLYVGITLAPLVVIFLIQMPFMLYTFGWRELGIIEPPRFYEQAEQFCYISSSCALLLLFEKKNSFAAWIIQKLIALVFLYVSLSIQGKRAILFFVIICIGIIMYYEFINRLRNNKNWKSLLFYIVVIGGVAVFYMITITIQVKLMRGVTSGFDDTNYVVTDQRVDFFRDDRVRVAIYSELYPDKMPILQYRGQTILPDVFGLLPLNYLKGRIPIDRKIYQTYFTCGLAGDNINSSTALRDSNWMTVTCIAEIMSNFSLFLAVFLVPWFFIKTATLIDRLKYPFNLLSMFAFVLLNLFDTTYVIVFIEFLLIAFWLLPKKETRVSL